MKISRRIILITAVLSFIFCILGLVIAWQTQLAAGLYFAISATCLLFILGIIGIIIRPPGLMPLWRKIIGIIFLVAFAIFFIYFMLFFYNNVLVLEL